MPFLSDPLEFHIQQLIKMFLQNSVLKETVTAYQLIKIGVSLKNNQLPGTSLGLPTATERKLRSCNTTHNLEKNVTFLVRIIQKFQEKSPLKYEMVGCLNCFVTKSMIERRE